MIRVRSRLQGQRHALAVGAALALICFALAWTHSAPAPSHMPAEGDRMAATLSVCLGVVSVGLALLVAGAMVSRQRRRPPMRFALTPALGPTRVHLGGLGNARAGPADLQVFLR